MLSWLSHNRQRLIQLVGTILAIVLLGLLLRQDGWGEILAATRKIQLIDLFWGLLLFLISRLATIGRWHVLLKSGGVDIHFKDSASLSFTGLFASNFLPTTIGGDVLRLAGAMKMGFDRAVCLASIAADRLIGMVGMIMVAPLGLVYSWSVLQSNPLNLSALACLQKPFAFVQRTFSVFSIWLKKPGSLLLSLGFTWLHMICWFGAIYLFLDDLGNHVSFWMIAGLWSLTYFISLIPISISGYGLQELSFTFLFSHVAGVTPAISLTVSVLVRAFQIIASLPGALFMPSAMAAMTEEQPSDADIVL